MWIVMSLPLVVGAVSSGWAGFGWGFLSAALCGGIPTVVIFGGVRRGWFGDRQQRPKLVAVIVALVVPALVLLMVLGALLVSVACVAIMLATLAVVGPITLA